MRTRRARGTTRSSVPAKDGVFYPRAGTLGGCTPHHAMITIYGHDSDWEHIADLTGDASWRPEAMRGYFERIERCGYVDKPGAGQPNPSRHGYEGWLPTTAADLKLALGDKALLQTVIDAVKAAWREGVGGGALPQVCPATPTTGASRSSRASALRPCRPRTAAASGTRELITADAGGPSRANWSSAEQPGGAHPVRRRPARRGRRVLGGAAPLRGRPQGQRRGPRGEAVLLLAAR